MKPNIELIKGGEDEVIIKGKKLSCRWLDSYILVWSGEEHKHE